MKKDMKIKAIINGKLEYLIGYEAKLYSLHGEKALLNYREYNEQSKDFLKSTLKENGKQRFVVRKQKDSFTANVSYEVEDDPFLQGEIKEKERTMNRKGLNYKKEN